MSFIVTSLPAAQDDVGGAAGGGQHDIRPNMADRAGFPARRFGRRVRQLVRPRQDEDTHRRANIFGSGRSARRRRRGRRQPHILPDRFSGHMVERTGRQRDDRQLFHQGLLGGHRDAVHIQDRRFPKTRRARRLFRPRYRF